MGTITACHSEGLLLVEVTEVGSRLFVAEKKKTGRRAAVAKSLSVRCSENGCQVFIPFGFRFRRVREQGIEFEREIAEPVAGK